MRTFFVWLGLLLIPPMVIFITHGQPNPFSWALKAQVVFSVWMAVSVFVAREFVRLKES